MELYPAAEHGIAYIHDPAITKEGDCYYIFGTHRRFAKSFDLLHWERLDNNITRNYKNLFKDLWQSWPQQETNPNIDGNMWAPDVIWNPSLGKWCMYMSINGDNYRSLIALLTADHLDGDWDLVGPVIYSGFTPENVEKTDVPQVLGNHADITRYQSLTNTRINAIDAGINFDEHGKLWMNFGSWFGGCWMVQLDPTTGLRDYTVEYQTIANVSDPYYGVKLAGGYWNSGEGTYLMHYGDWWYLFISYGWLGRTGGYQVREFRSHSITGPYLDEAGNPAISTSKVANNWTTSTGIRLLSSYQWIGGPQQDGPIEVAQGHNSALIDSDGSIYMVYHTRFANQGEDSYQTMIRQLLPTADSWLTAAPFTYQGVRAGQSHNKLLHAEQLAGDWEVIVHCPSTFFNDKQGEHTRHQEATADGTTGINMPLLAHVEANGRFTLDNTQGSKDGNWQLLQDKSESIQHIQLTNGSDDYEGCLSFLPDDASNQLRFCLSAIGNNISLWATKI